MEKKRALTMPRGWTRPCLMKDRRMTPKAVLHHFTTRPRPQRPHHTCPSYPQLLVHHEALASQSTHGRYILMPRLSKSHPDNSFTCGSESNSSHTRFRLFLFVFPFLFLFLRCSGGLNCNGIGDDTYMNADSTTDMRRICTNRR